MNGVVVGPLGSGFLATSLDKFGVLWLYLPVILYRIGRGKTTPGIYKRIFSHVQDILEAKLATCIIDSGGICTLSVE